MVPLKPIDLDFAHHIRLQFVAKVPPGTTIDDVTDPMFWVNHTQRLRPGSIIEVLAEDNSLDCELRVLEVGATFARVRVLRNFVPDEAQTKRDAPAGVEVNYAGKVDKWRIVHLGQIVQAGLETREAAEKAADAYRAKLAA